MITGTIQYKILQIHIYNFFLVFLSFSNFTIFPLANDLAEQERPDDRRRRTSDSFLHLSPKEDEVTLMRLKQTESKLNFKVQLLEKEIEELKLAAVKEKEGTNNKDTSCVELPGSVT